MTELFVSTELHSSQLESPLNALLSALPPACETCSPAQYDQASMLVMWLEIGRLKSVADGVSRILEAHGCLHRAA